MDLERILATIQPFVVLFVALTAAFFTALWVSAVIWAFRDIRSRTRDVFAQILATLLVLIFFPLFPLPGLILYVILRPRETLAEVYERTLEEEALLQGIEERLACPTCNRRIEEDYVVCPSCHTRLKKSCVSCGRQLHLNWSICAYCGAAQTTATVPVLQPQPVTVEIEPAADPSVLSPPASSFLPEPEMDAEDESEDLPATVLEAYADEFEGIATTDWEIYDESADQPEAESEIQTEIRTEISSEPEGETVAEASDEVEAESGASAEAEATDDLEPA
jgi:RNA polymerase subunit RPABC4/transcription elongation factor Spt4